MGRPVRNSTGPGTPIPMPHRCPGSDAARTAQLAEQLLDALQGDVRARRDIGRLVEVAEDPPVERRDRDVDRRCPEVRHQHVARHRRGTSAGAAAGRRSTARARPRRRGHGPAARRDARRRSPATGPSGPRPRCASGSVPGAPRRARRRARRASRRAGGRARAQRYHRARCRRRCRGCASGSRRRPRTASYTADPGLLHLTSESTMSAGGPHTVPSRRRDRSSCLDWLPDRIGTRRTDAGAPSEERSNRHGAPHRHPHGRHRQRLHRHRAHRGVAPDRRQRRRAAGLHGSARRGARPGRRRAPRVPEPRRAVRGRHASTSSTSRAPTSSTPRR